MLRQFRIAAVLLAALANAGCGIKGPLVLPPATPVSPAPSAATPSAASVPSPSPTPVDPTAPAKRP